MKRIFFAVVMACCTLALAAQNDAIRVNYKGARPTISDFAWAYLSDAVIDDDGCFDESTNAIKQAWIRHRKGLAPEQGKLTVDEKNGYVLYEIRDGEHLLIWEMCYWNEADGKHKLFAYNVALYTNGKYTAGQYDGITFYRYNNATKTMTPTSDVGIEEAYPTEMGASTSFTLPRTGKDLVVTWTWSDTGKVKKHTMKWNGRRFSF
ncbi:MAG: hypothetical protein IKH86_06065 [Prevotella sp.]|jgi:hypothetical protein|nr:hypothetical protein [Prevotella sp.]